MVIFFFLLFFNFLYYSIYLSICQDISTKKVVFLKCKFCQNQIPDGSIFCNFCGERQRKQHRRPGEIKVPTPRQLPSGAWNIYLRAEGQSVTEATPEACVLKAKAIRAGYAKPAEKAHTGSEMTLRQAVTAYIEKYRAVLSPSTIRGYTQYRDHRFKRYMDTKIKALPDWQTIINEEMEEVNAKTVKNAWSFVHAALADIGIDARVKLPPIIRREHPWLEPEELGRFLTAVRGNRHEIPILLALLGLRRSEIMAVTWDKVDLDRRTILVHGAVVQNDAGTFVSKAENKQTASRREIRIIIPRLLDLLKAVPEEERAGPLMRCHPNTIYMEINRICRRNGLPAVGVHGLRHTFASAALEMGVSESDAQHMGGWADAGTMHRIYEHIGNARKLRTESSLEEFFNRFTDENTDGK